MRHNLGHVRRNLEGGGFTRRVSDNPELSGDRGGLVYNGVANAWAAGICNVYDVAALFVAPRLLKNA